MRSPLHRIFECAAIVIPWGMLIAYLHIFWSYSPQYEYGWLVVPFAMRLFYLRWNTLSELERTPGIGASGATVLFAFLLAPVWFIRQATTHWSVPGYGLTALVVAYTFSMLALMGGWRLSRRMAIPVLFVFCAVKLPLTPEQWMIQSLSRFVAAASAEILHLLGIPALNSGNLVVLSKGVIGISEACSGIHSLQSLLMVALFLGEERRMRIRRRFFMLGLGVALSLAFNVLRILFLSFICLRYGMDNFEHWHDRAGWSILLVSLGIMIFVANELGGKVKSDGSGPHRDLLRIPPWMAAALTGWFLLIIGGTEAWYRFHDAQAQHIQHLEIYWPTNKMGYTPVEIPDRVRDITLCSDGKSARWREADDTEWSLSLLEFGGGPKGTSQWAPMHTPDICYPSAGMPLLRTHPVAKLKVPGGQMLFQCWEFKRRVGTVLVFYSLHDESNLGPSELFMPDLLGLSRALKGQRNLGQQTVEIAVTGFASYTKALEAIRQRFPSMVEITK